MVLAYKDGDDVRFVPDKSVLGKLAAKYGPGLRSFWKSEFGHAIECLTHVEAYRLLSLARELEGEQPGGSLLDSLRDRIRS